MLDPKNVERNETIVNALLILNAVSLPAYQCYLAFRDEYNQDKSLFEKIRKAIGGCFFSGSESKDVMTRSPGFSYSDVSSSSRSSFIENLASAETDDKPVIQNDNTEIDDKPVVHNGSTRKYFQKAVRMVSLVRNTVFNSKSKSMKAIFDDFLFTFTVNFNLTTILLY